MVWFSVGNDGDGSITWLHIFLANVAAPTSSSKFKRFLALDMLE